jgi:hypothetical protein
VCVCVSMSVVALVCVLVHVIVCVRASVALSLALSLCYAPVCATVSYLRVQHICMLPCVRVSTCVHAMALITGRWMFGASFCNRELLTHPFQNVAALSVSLLCNLSSFLISAPFLETTQ